MFRYPVPVPIAGLLILAATLSMSCQARAQDNDIDKAIEQVAGSIVQIETTGGAERLGGRVGASAPSTGVVVGGDGWIISSSFNLAHNPSGVVVTLADQSKHAAKIIAKDENRHLVLLKINAQDLPVPNAVPAPEIAVGMSAVALGKTWDAAAPSRSYGIVSATNRIWGQAIQTDANVSPVNYGGPLIDRNGRVLGVLAPLSPQQDTEAAGAMWYDAGIGFAIPFADVLDQLERFKQGDLRRGLLGIRFGTDDLLAEPRVDFVSWRSPADLAGLQKGDVITAVNGGRTRWVGEFRHALGPLYAGDAARFQYRRGEETFDKAAALIAELPVYHWPKLGIQFDLAHTGPGLRIQRLLEGSAASETGLLPGDILLSCNGVELKSAEEAHAAVNKLAVGEPVALKLTRDGEEMELSIETQALPAAFAGAAKTTAEDEMPTKLMRESVAGVKTWTARLEAEAPPPRVVVLCFVGKNGPTAEQLHGYWKPLVREGGVLLAGVEPVGEQPEGQAMQLLWRHISKDEKLSKLPVVVHGFADGCPQALAFLQPHRQAVCGLLLWGAPPVNLQPMQPETALAIHWFLPAEQANSIQLRDQIQSLQQRGYSIVRQTIAPKQLYFAPDHISQIGLWLDWVTSL